MVAPGTGLGTATLIRNGEGFRPAAAEGGHASWAPVRDDDLSLWRALSARHGRVSIERVVSGPGLEAIFDDVVASGIEPSRRAADRLDAASDRAAAISEFALAGRDRAATRALDRFVRYLGAAAGDLALAVGAIGGVYVAGGIAPKILPRIESGLFLEAFRDKGRLGSLVSTIPVRVVLEPRCALIGAATYAALAPPEDRPRSRGDGS
jgi:glucokinase